MVRISKTIAANKKGVVLGHIPPQPPYPPQPELREVAPPNRHIDVPSSDEERQLAADLHAELLDFLQPWNGRISLDRKMEADIEHKGGRHVPQHLKFVLYRASPAAS